MDGRGNPGPPVTWLVTAHTLFLLFLPVMANFTVLPLVADTSHAPWWVAMNLVGVPVAFAGVMAINPYPRTTGAAALRTLLLPLLAGFFWWKQGGSLTSYFAVMLVFEMLAMFGSLLLQSFIPLRVYDPEHPRAGSLLNNIQVLVFQGLLVSGFLIFLVLMGTWPWLQSEPFWRLPTTGFVLAVAMVNNIAGNFRWHRLTSARRHRGQQRNLLDETVSIEPVLLLAPLPWLASYWFLGN